MLFDTPKIKQLELEEGYELIVGGYGGHQHTLAFQTQINTLAIDSIAYKDVNFGYIPISETRFFIRPDQAGFMLSHDQPTIWSDGHEQWLLLNGNGQLNIIYQSIYFIAKFQK